MVFGHMPAGMGLDNTVNFEALVHIRVEGAAARKPRLAPGAAWLSSLAAALSHTPHRAGDFSALIVTVTAVYPRDEDPAAIPDTSQSDYVPELRDHVVAAFEGSAWENIFTSVEVHEEWRLQAGEHLEIAVYGWRSGDEAAD